MKQYKSPMIVLVEDEAESIFMNGSGNYTGSVVRTSIDTQGVNPNWAEYNVKFKTSVSGVSNLTITVHFGVPVSVEWWDGRFNIVGAGTDTLTITLPGPVNNAGETVGANFKVVPISSASADSLPMYP